MDKEQEIINEQWSQGATNYNSIIEDEIHSFRAAAWKKQILDQTPKEGCLDVLDCGCGPGFFSCIMAQEGHRVTAIDGSESMLEYAGARAQANGLSVTFLHMDCHELETGAASRRCPSDLRCQLASVPIRILGA